MTNHVGRLYALGISLAAFFLAWALVAAHPWSTVKAARDPRLSALAQREQRLRQQSRLVQQVVNRRYSDYRRQFAAYKVALAKRQTQIAASRLASARAAASAAAAPVASYTPSSSYTPSAASSVRVVTLPPVVITRTS